MAGIAPLTGVAIDQKEGEAKAHPFAAEAWLEPLLCKNNFYRTHFTRDGRRESKSTRRGSVITEGLESRKNSVASPEDAAEAAAAVGTGPEPAAPERRGSEGSDEIHTTN